MSRWRTCRGFSTADELPALHVSTYEAGAALISVRPGLAALSERQRIKKGYKEQSALVLRQLEEVVARWQARRESGIVEGVHLNLKAVATWMTRFPSVLPFLVRLSPCTWCQSSRLT